MFGWFKPKQTQAEFFRDAWSAERSHAFVSTLIASGYRMRRGLSRDELVQALVDMGEGQRHEDPASLIRAYTREPSQLSPPIIQRYAPWTEFI